MDDYYLDIVFVDYNNGSKELCFAPLSKVEMNDVVETEWGRGKVAEIVTVNKVDKFFKLANKVYHIRPVIAVINPIKYEVKDDLSEE